MVIICLSTIAAAFAIGCPLTAVMRAAAGRLGQLDEPGERKIHDRAIPVTGGIAIFWAVAAPLSLALLAAWIAPASWWASISEAIEPHLPGIRQQTPMGIALLFGLLAMHVMGLIDDRLNLGPFVKLAVQAVAAGVLVVAFDVRLFEWFGPVASIGLTLVWFIVIINAFNFLDNMDGLTGGVTVICAAVLMTTALLGGQWFIAATLGLLIGAVLGFLVFNFPPASIFMGDCGSLVIGFLMAFCSVRVTYFDEAAAPGHWWAVFTPLVVLAIPLYDFTSVTVIRILQGRSPFQGDTQHFSHRLVRKGLSRRGAVIVIYACTLATALGGVLLGRLDAAWQAVLVVAQTGAVLLALGLLERSRGGSRA